MVSHVVLILLLHDLVVVESVCQVHLLRLLVHCSLVLVHLLGKLEIAGACWSLDWCMRSREVQDGTCIWGGWCKHTMGRACILNVSVSGRCWLCGLKGTSGCVGLILSAVPETKINVTRLVSKLGKLCIDLVALNVVIVIIWITDPIYFFVKSFIKLAFRLLNPLSIKLVS